MLKIKYIFGVIGATVGYLIGGVDAIMYALIMMVILDYLTGVMVAILEKRLASSIGYKGIFKKISIFILVSVAHIIDSQVIGDGSVLRTSVTFFYIANEGISILENSVKIGVPVPQKLQEVLLQLKKEGDE